MEPQTLALAEGRLVDLDRIGLARFRQLEHSNLVCPRCLKTLQLLATEAGPRALHIEEAGHEPEDLVRHLRRQELCEHLQAAFSQARVKADVELQGLSLLCDAALVSDAGAKIAVFVLADEYSKAELAGLAHTLEASGGRSLWLLEGQRLKKHPQQQTLVLSVTLKRLETALLALSRPLIYIGPERRRLSRIYVPSSIAELAKSDDSKPLGRIKALIRSYPLSQLRVIDGSWSLGSDFDPPLPEPPPIPAALQKRLAYLKDQ